MVARLRPRRPIVALSHHQYALQQMALEWGVTPLLIPEQPNVEELWSLSIESARDAGIVAAGRPRRDHGGHAGQHPRLDQRDQGRRRLSPQDAARAAARTGATMATSRRKRAPESRLLCAGSAVGALVLVGVPLLQAARTYLARASTRSRRARPRCEKLRASEHAQLAAAGRRLDERRRARARGASARATCKPGEQLFIVKGIERWRKRAR